MNEEVDAEPQVALLAANAAVKAALWAYIDGEGTVGLTGYARSLGLQAPDTRPGWEVSMFAAPDDPDVDLYWLLETENPNRIG